MEIALHVSEYGIKELKGVPKRKSVGREVTGKGVCKRWRAEEGIEEGARLRIRTVRGVT